VARLSRDQQEAVERLREVSASPYYTDRIVHPIHCFPHDGWTPEGEQAFWVADQRGIAMAIELERLGVVEIFPNTSSGIMVRLLPEWE